MSEPLIVNAKTGYHSHFHYIEINSSRIFTKGFSSLLEIHRIETFSITWN